LHGLKRKSAAYLFQSNNEHYKLKWEVNLS
jgi:hypothetical protein